MCLYVYVYIGSLGISLLSGKLTNFADFATMQQKNPYKSTVLSLVCVLFCLSNLTPY